MPKQQEHICTVARIRELERAIFRREDSFAVMRRAGDHIASACEQLPGTLVFAAGRGNNGGDAIVAASILAAKGRSVRLWLPLGKPRARSDAARALRLWRAAGGELAPANCKLDAAGVIVDGLFGIGLDRELAGSAARVVARINAAARPVVAIDVPSGICADSGRLMGAAVAATTTVTIFALKPGLLMEHGRAHAGDVRLASLGYPLKFTGADGTRCAAGQGLACLHRHPASHKGAFGSLAVIGGADGMLGALVLATRAAVAHGAGKVHAVPLGAGLGVDGACPEVMWRRRPTSGHTALAIGVGLGQDDNAAAGLGATLASPKPAVVDADALNLIATSRPLRARLRRRAAPTVLTPHPAEAGRLLGCSAEAIQADRVGSARQLARRFACVVVLKGAGSVVASEQGWQIVGAGNAALAQAGSGDLLTGTLGALLAQGMAAHDASATAAFVNGAGAELATVEHGGKLGVPLGEILACSARILAWQVEATSS